MNMFEYVIQFGAILAVILLYFNKLNPFSKPTVQAQKDTWQLWAKVIIAVLPSVVVGLPLNDWMDKHLHTPLVVATTLILYGFYSLFWKITSKISTRTLQVWPTSPIKPLC